MNSPGFFLIVLQVYKGRTGLLALYFISLSQRKPFLLTGNGDLFVMKSWGLLNVDRAYEQQSGLSVLHNLP